MLKTVAAIIVLGLSSSAMGWKAIEGDVHPNVRDRIAAALTNRQCPPTDCTVDVAAAVPGDWDHLYIFGSTESDQDISQIIKKKYASRTPGTSKYLLLKDGAVVYREEDSTHGCGGEFCFAYYWVGPCLLIDRQHSTIKVVVPQQIQMKTVITLGPTDSVSQICSASNFQELFD